jgi:hypothetical protein
MMRGLRSGEVAAAVGVNLQTLRYYERRGLLAEPERTPGGHRVYSRDAVTMVRIIKATQRLGFTLDEVAGLQDGIGTEPGRRPDCGGRWPRSSRRWTRGSPISAPSAGRWPRRWSPAATILRPAPRAPHAPCHSPSWPGRPPKPRRLAGRRRMMQTASSAGGPPWGTTLKGPAPEWGSAPATDGRTLRDDPLGEVVRCCADRAAGRPA